MARDRRAKPRAVSERHHHWLGPRNHPDLTATQLTALGPLLSPGDQLRYRIGTPLPRRPQSASGRGDRLASAFPPAVLRLVAAVRGTGRPATPTRGAPSIALLFLDTRLWLRARLISFSAQFPSSQRSVGCACCVSAATGSTFKGAHPAGRLPRHHRNANQLPAPAGPRLQQPPCAPSVAPDLSRHQHTRRYGGTTRIARCYLYERLSGMPVSAAPFAHGDTEAHNKGSDFPRRLTPELTTALLRHAKDFLERQASATN